MPPHVTFAERPRVEIGAISKFDNWDWRECAVSNSSYWKKEVQNFIAQHGGRPPIPNTIHQIWIGTREPPCIWLDSWRINFMNQHGKINKWGYRLWDNQAVQEMRQEQQLINSSLFDRESMWQCKADLLRLEILYRYGGVYIDADMISLGKSLDSVLHLATETGFGVSFEADTKDKPYSVLGNSIIFASKGHPLLRLLIEYISQIYDHKRPYFGVEWVTGPLAFTKALMHSQMPITLIPRQYFYANFQYVPNPSAIDTSAFPDSLAFQFGYTCSGLADWVKQNNRCRKPMYCSHHYKVTEYPLGKIVPFPDIESLPEMEETSIPKVIHQFCFSANPPRRWIDTWAQQFCTQNPGWLHKLWNYESLSRLGSFFCANLYPARDKRMDEEVLKLLAMEVLFKEGGYYVPLSVIYNSDAEQPLAPCEPTSVQRFQLDSKHHGRGEMSFGSIIASPKNGLTILKQIVEYYENGEMNQTDHPLPPFATVCDMSVPDSIASYMSFPDGSRFLGAGEIFFSTYSSRRSNRKAAMLHALHLAYDSQVCCYPLVDKSLEQVRKSQHSAVIITDSAIVSYPRMTDAISGLIYRTQLLDPNWDLIVFALEWNAGEDAEVVYRVRDPFMGESQKCFGVVVNVGRAALLPSSVKWSPGIIETALGYCKTKSVYAGVVRFAYSEELSAIFCAMPVVENAFQRIAGHTIPGWHRDGTEVHGRLLKGLRGGQVAFELVVDEDQRIMYRSFNDDGGMNCEAKIIQGGMRGSLVEYARVFFDHAVVYEGTNVCF